jgi:hypothetical protein
VPVLAAFKAALPSIAPIPSPSSVVVVPAGRPGPGELALDGFALNLGAVEFTDGFLHSFMVLEEDKREGEFLLIDDKQVYNTAALGKDVLDVFLFDVSRQSRDIDLGFDRVILGLCTTRRGVFRARSFLGGASLTGWGLAVAVACAVSRHYQYERLVQP